jgi:hypothetical protein
MSNAIIRRASLLGLVAAVISPAMAFAEPLTPIGMFQNANHFVQAIMLGLILATVAAVIVCMMKLMSGPGLSGGSAYLSALRFGGPVAGLLGAAWGGMLMAFSLANTAAAVPGYVLARGGAETMALVVLGLLCGAVAVICKWAVDARIDRAILKA